MVSAPFGGSPILDRGQGGVVDALGRYWTTNAATLGFVVVDPTGTFVSAPACTATSVSSYSLAADGAEVIAACGYPTVSEISRTRVSDFGVTRTTITPAPVGLLAPRDGVLWSPGTLSVEFADETSPIVRALPDTPLGFARH